MELITKIPISNLINSVLMIIITAAALIKLTDENKRMYIENVALIMIAMGAFFQLSKIYEPDGTPPDLIVFRLGLTIYATIHTLAWLKKYLTLGDIDNEK